MKKRILVMMTAMVLAMGMMACGKDDAKGNETTNQESGKEDVKEDNGNKEDSEDKDETLTAVGILEKVLESYSDEDKPDVFGGDTEHIVEGTAGAYDISDVEGIDATFHITKEAVDMADEAASAVHMMNANNFTSSVFHLKNASDKDAFASSVKESVLSTRWMCGFPEKLVIISVNDEYVVSAFGNGDMMEAFKTQVTEVFGNSAAVIAEEIIE